MGEKVWCIRNVEAARSRLQDTQESIVSFLMAA